MKLFHLISFYNFATKISTNAFVIQNHRISNARLHPCIKMSSDDAIDVEADDVDAEIGTMRVSELKSELKLRGIDYSDCFDKESLAKKLRDARASGKSDPTIIDQFNKQRVRIYGLLVFIWFLIINT